MYSDSQVYGLGWEQLILPRLVSESDIDVLFCPNSDGPVRSLDVPVVVRLHDIFGFVGYGPRLYTLLQQFRVPRMLSAADRIVAPSRHTRSTVTSRIDPDTPIDVVPNGLQEVFLDDHAGSAVSLPDEYLLYVGGTGKRKNTEVLVDSYIALREEYDVPHELVLVGPQERFIDGHVGDSAGSDREQIRSLGFLTARELKYVYTQASAFLFPSLEEGFGLPPLEAIACGTPVIAGNRPAMTEILPEDTALADPTDPDEFASRTAALLEAGDPGPTNEEIDHARSFTWDRAVDEISTTLRRAIDQY